MKIAYFTPVSPQKTGISDYSEKEVLPYLSRYVDIDVFIDTNVNPVNSYLRNNFDIYCYTDYEKRKKNYDIPLYQMGNNQFHEFIYHSLIRNPGITVFHDIFLHGFLWSVSLAQGNADRYREEFTYCYGKKGLSIAECAIQTGSYPTFQYPLIRKILDHSLGIICHNEFCIQIALREKPDINVTKIYHPLTIPKDTSELEKRNSLRIIKDYLLETKNPIIVSFGFISSHKRHHVLLKSFKRLLIRYPDAVLLLVGKDLMGIDNLIDTLDLSKSVIMTGFIPFTDIINFLAVADFCVNLRYPTAGETSGSVLRIMAAQKPVIVSDVGWFSEIPDDCCLKVPVDMYEEDLLLAYMETLASNPEMKGIIGSNAQKWIRNDHNPEKIAKDFYRYIKSVVNGDEIVMTQVSEALVELGINEDDEEIIKHISRSIQSII